MFKKSGDKKTSPQKMGRNDQEVGDGVVKFYLELPEMEGEPVFLLEDSLNIGSQEGDVIIDHASVAPNHCSINLNQDVLSIIDHGSKTGTKVNKRAIPAGKMIILNIKDKIEIGSVRAQITQREESVPVMPPPFQYEKTGTKEIKSGGLELEPPAVPLPTEDINPDEHTLVLPDTPVDDEGEPVKKGLFGGLFGKKASKKKEKTKEKKNKNFSPKKSKKKKSKITAVSARDASNGFLRVMGLICDALIIGIAHILLSSEEVYRQLLNDLPRFVQDYLGPVYKDLLEPHAKTLLAVPQVEGVVEMVQGLAPENWMLWAKLAILLGLYRLVTSLILGASLGQFLVGIRAGGSALTKRILAPLRWLFGLVFLPIFFIADFPALFSKRTLKEVFSFTRLETPSTVMAILSMLIFIPVLVTAFLIGPALKGMQIPTPQTFVPMKKVELGVFDLGSIDSDSSYFSIGVPSDQVDYALPKFRFSQKGARKSLRPSLVLGKGEQSVELRLIRKIELSELFRKFTSLNPMAELKYPEITSFVNNSKIISNSIKAPAYAPLPIAMETQKLLAASLGLAPMEPKLIADFLTDNGPFIGAFMEFRKALSSLMGEGAKQYRLRQLGNAIVIEGEYSLGRKVIKRFLPLNKKGSHLYELTYNKEMRPAFIDLMAWNIEATKEDDAMTLLSFVDVLMPGKKTNVLEVFQRSNETYYELGKTALVDNDAELYSDLQMSIQGALQVLMENSKALGLPEKASQKLAQNLNDLLKALKDRDMEYFGVRRVGLIKELEL